MCVNLFGCGATYSCYGNDSPDLQFGLDDVEEVEDGPLGRLGMDFVDVVRPPRRVGVVMLAASICLLVWRCIDLE